MMRGKTRIYLAGSGVALCGLLALAGCGGGFGNWGAERAAWRAQAENDCLKSGAVKLDGGVVQMSSIDGPGMCGAEFPLKVSALGEGGVAMSYADQIRPPGSVPQSSVPTGSMPRWPANNSYSPPPQYNSPRPPQQYGAEAPVQYGAPPRDLGSQARDLAAPSYSSPSYPPSRSAEPMRITPSGVDDYSAPRTQPAYNPPQNSQRYEPPRTQPAYNSSPRYTPPPSPADEAEEVADDIPDDAILPRQQRRAPAQQQRTYSPPSRYESPRLGPERRIPVTQVKAAVSPPATLACPIVSALDKWVSESVQPAALRWFNQPVVEIKQISSYSCRGMVGGSGVSEHSYGNALDVAGFILADGRKVLVKTGWNGAPEESGFLHDVQGAACGVFTTVLAPGYNVYHYNHIHVDLMRRASGKTPCRPTPIAGEVAAAKQAQKSKYAHRNDRLTTGSVSRQTKIAVPGEDGEADDGE